jgi:hypothetical protein
MYQMNTKCTNVRKILLMAINITTFSNLRPTKIYPNWDFWFEKKPSGNPGLTSALLPRRGAALVIAFAARREVPLFESPPGTDVMIF